MTPGNQAESGWQALYYAGAAAALVAALIFRRNLGAELTAFNGFGILTIPAEEPVSALDWFMAFEEDWLAGLALFHFGDVVNYLLVGLIFLALYGALRRINQGAMLAATAFGFMGIAVNMATNRALAMYALSNRYSEAASEVQRGALLASGEALLAIENPSAAFKGTGYNFSLFLVLAAGLVISIVMLRSTIFPKATAYTGIVANGIALGFFVTLLLAPSLIWLPPTASALFRIAWYILIAVGLLRLGRQMNQQSKSWATKIRIEDNNYVSTTINCHALMAQSGHDRALKIAATHVGQPDDHVDQLHRPQERQMLHDAYQLCA